MKKRNVNRLELEKAFILAGSQFVNVLQMLVIKNKFRIISVDNKLLPDIKSINPLHSLKKQKNRRTLLYSKV